jgi:hypothetical protein
VNAKAAVAPDNIDGDGIACDAGLNSREQPLLAQQPVDER